MLMNLTFSVLFHGKMSIPFMDKKDMVIVPVHVTSNHVQAKGDFCTQDHTNECTNMLLITRWTYKTASKHCICKQVVILVVQ